MLFGDCRTRSPQDVFLMNERKCRNLDFGSFSSNDVEKPELLQVIFLYKHKVSELCSVNTLTIQCGYQ